METDAALNVAAYILAGGKSSRFGSDKARAVLAGQALISRIADAVLPCVSGVTVIADVADKYADLGLRTIQDQTPGQGPLAGLEAALLDCDTPWLLLLSCDLIDIRALWVEALLRMRTDDARCVAYRPGGLWQPMLALYHTSVTPIVTRRIIDRRLRMQELLNELSATEAPLPADWPDVLQANTPDALDRPRLR